VSAEIYSVGTLARKAIASASVDLPAPGVPAIIDISDLRITTLLASKVRNTDGKGSPPISILPTARARVLIYYVSPISL
jgi:hypothetical protein